MRYVIASAAALGLAAFVVASQLPAGAQGAGRDTASETSRAAG